MHERRIGFAGLALCSAAIVAATSVAAPASTKDASAPAILVSRQLAEALGLANGDVIQLSADPAGKAPRPFRIAGTYEPVANPMRLTAERREVRLHLPDLQGLLADPADAASADSISAINLALADPADAPAFARDFAARMPGLVARPTEPQDDEDNPFIVLRRFHFAIAVVTVVASTIFLLALMVMLVEERRETIGMLRLIGLQKRRILVQLFAEGLLIALAGAVAGTLLAAASQGLLNRFFQWRYDTSLVFVRVTPEIAGRCLLIAVPLGMLASLIASWGLLRRDVMELARR